MQTINILDLAPQIRELINQIQVGQDLLITADDHTVAKITRVNGTTVEPVPAKRKRRRAGTAQGNFWMAPDFNEPLEDFAEYM